MAHGKVTENGGIWRYVKPANPLTYMESMETGGYESALAQLEGPDTVFEFMLNALRLTAGFDIGLFAARTGLAPALLADRFTRLRQKQLIDEVEPGYWRLTGLGKRFLNDVQAEFLP